MSELTKGQPFSDSRFSGRAGIEVIRRLGLVISLAIAIALAFWTGFEPYLKVSLAPRQEEASARRLPEQPAARPGSLLAQPATRKGEGNLVTVSGPEWEALFAGVEKSFTRNYPIPGWEHRIPRRDLTQAREDNQRRGGMTASDLKREAERVHRLKAKYAMDVTFRGSFRQLYFRAGESPFSSLAAQWQPGTYLLQLAGEPEVRLAASYLPAYQLRGFSDVITLPEAFAYPYRAWAPWVAVAGLALYLVLPWGRPPANVLAYVRWRVIMGDLAAGLFLFAGFFAIPIAVIGGTVEAVTEFLPFTLVFWLVAALGLLGVYWAAWAAAYRLAVLPEGVEITGLTGRSAFTYEEITKVQPVRLLPPRWLIVLSWLAFFLRRSPGQAGRSLLLQSSTTKGLRLDLAGGPHVYVWYSDQMGGTAVQHFERLGQALKREGIRWIEEPIEIRALFPPRR